MCCSFFCEYVFFWFFSFTFCCELVVFVVVFMLFCCYVNVIFVFWATDDVLFDLLYVYGFFVYQNY